MCVHPSRSTTTVRPDSALPRPLVRLTRLSVIAGDLQVDLLSLYLIRSVDGNILLSYHHSDTPRGTAPSWLQKRIYIGCQSPHWRQAFADSEDPALVLLLLMWCALSSWGQAIDVLWKNLLKLVSGPQTLQIRFELNSGIPGGTHA